MGKPTGEAVVQAAIRLVDRSYDEMDCQGMIEEAVRKAGGSMSYSGSNAMARGRERPHDAQGSKKGRS